jgi:hypothetical protein
VRIAFREPARELISAIDVPKPTAARSSSGQLQRLVIAGLLSHIYLSARATSSAPAKPLALIGAGKMGNMHKRENQKLSSQCIP